MDTRRRFLSRAPFLVGAIGGILRSGGRAWAQDSIAGINNPYAGIDAGMEWLKGEIHTHLPYGADAAALDASYQAAVAVGMQFVAPSVEVTELTTGPDHFAETGDAGAYGLVAIPAREIQNDLYGVIPYFSEPGAGFLHILTLGPNGPSLCAHPRLYDMMGWQQGSWDGIRSALLRPLPGDRLEQLRPVGIEVFNSFTLASLRQLGQQEKYRDYDESCWDELLMAGKSSWGFAGNDILPSHDYARAATIGSIHVAGASRSQDDILAAISLGRFYSSSGVILSNTPLSIREDSDGLRVFVQAETDVDWTVKLFRGIPGGLETHLIREQRQANFLLPPRWSFFRVQCQSPTDPWQRAWLQPVTRR